jgi:3-oxosteroid 1-dehydrogenase
MAEAGFADSVEAGITYLQSVVGEFGPAATSARQETYIRGARRMLTLLQNLGLQFVMISKYADYYPENPGGTLEGRMIDSPLFDGRRLEQWPERVQPRPKLPGGLVVGTLEEFRALFMLGRSRAARRQLAKLCVNTARLKARGVKPLVLGAAFVGQLLLAAQQQGVRFRTKTPMRELIVDGGRVVGVVIDVDGRREEIRARAGVILSAGGYAHDLALRHEHGPAPASVDWTLTVPTDTGDGLRAASEVGAASTALGEAFYLPALLDHRGLPQLMIAERHLPGSILVDASGVRFTNEATPYMQLGQDMYARQPLSAAVPSWLILDSRHRNRYSLGVVLPRVPPRAWLKSGHLKKAATIPDLAVASGLDPRALERTIARFNPMALAGRDEDFHRGDSAYDRLYSDPRVTPNPCLGPLDQAPFYAAKLVPADVGTAGGVLTNEYAEALEADGTAIPGLFACGNTAASAMGRMYPGGGVSLGQSAVFGFVAMERIVKLGARSGVSTANSA